MQFLNIFFKKYFLLKIIIIPTTPKIQQFLYFSALTLLTLEKKLLMLLKYGFYQ